MSNEFLKNENIGNQMYEIIEKLFPICRSITGNGVRETLNIIKKYIPIEIHEIASGTSVYDWEIPKEWNVKDGYIKNSKGEKIINFKKSNLHVMSYSIPINKKIKVDELKQHVYTLPKFSDRIPYITSYYEERWGFSMSHDQFLQLNEEEYEVVIDSSLEKGFLTYGELFLKGEITDEVLFSTYVCHPSMCNDNLSGISLLVFLARIIQKMNPRFSYRFLFIPETIGAITWLKLNEQKTEKIKYGLVATCVGDSGKSTYKKARNEDALINSIVEKVLIDSKESYEISSFYPIGSDERQFCSPGFNLPIGSLMRTPYLKFNEYHTSADNLDFVKSNALVDSLKKYLDVVYIIENNFIPKSLNLKCEPRIGKRKKFRSTGGKMEPTTNEDAIFWILNFSDGNHSLLDISIKSKINFRIIKQVTDELIEDGFLESKNFQ